MFGIPHGEQLLRRQVEIEWRGAAHFHTEWCGSGVFLLGAVRRDIPAVRTDEDLLWHGRVL